MLDIPQQEEDPQGDLAREALMYLRDVLVWFYSPTASKPNEYDDAFDSAKKVLSLLVEIANQHDPETTAEMLKACEQIAKGRSEYLFDAHARG